MRKTAVASNEYKQKPEIRQYSIEAKPYQLDTFEEFLSAVQQLGAIGASRELQIGIDGDGAARIKVQRIDSKIELKRAGDLNTDKDVIIMTGID